MPAEVRPYSAEKVEVNTLNSLRASTEGAVWSNAEPLSERVVLTPSSRTSVLKFCPPLSFDWKIPEELAPFWLVPGPWVPGVRKTNVSGERRKLWPDEFKDNGKSKISFVPTTVPISEVSV